MTKTYESIVVDGKKNVVFVTGTICFQQHTHVFDYLTFNYQLSKWMTLGKMWHLKKWVTLEKMGHIRKNGSLRKRCQIWKNGSHLEK